MKINQYKNVHAPIRRLIKIACGAKLYKIYHQMKYYLVSN